MINLRTYQNEMIQGARSALRVHKSILLQAPTGAGKTVLAAFMIGQTAARGETAWFICHRRELVEGTSNTFKKYGIHHGLIAAGNPPNPAAHVQICSIDTLKGRIATLKPPRVAIIDEAHHSAAAGWSLVIEWLKAAGSLVIGLSATPERLDGQGLNDLFDYLVPGPSVSWLMDQGFLSQYKIFAPSMPDLKGVPKRGGDYAKAETGERMDKPKLIGDMITHWKKHAEGLRTVGFGVHVKHSRHLAESFTLAGIPAAHLDGGTDKAERKKIISDYADGKILVLFNVGLFGEGFDLSSIAQRDITIDAGIDAAPTQSLAWHLQKIGRVLRPAPGKTAIWLDHAGNSMRHGFPEDDRQWSLEGKEARQRAANDNTEVPPPVICEQCFNAIKRPLPPCCPHCGKSLQAEAKKIEVAEGNLQELTASAKAAARAAIAREQAEARTLEELVTLAQKRKYKSPVTWAQKVYAGRRR